VPPSNPTPQRSAEAATPLKAEPSTRTPRVEELMDRLQKQVVTLSQSFGRMQLGMERLHQTVGHVAELSGRLTMLLAVMGGVPRSFAHGPVAMGLWAGIGGHHYLARGSRRGPGGPGGRGGSGGFGGRDGPGGPGGGFDPKTPQDRAYANIVRRSLLSLVQFNGLAATRLSHIEKELKEEYDQTGVYPTHQELKARYTTSSPDVIGQGHRGGPAGQPAAPLAPGSIALTKTGAAQKVLPFDIETPMSPDGLEIDFKDDAYRDWVRQHGAITQFSASANEAVLGGDGRIEGYEEKHLYEDTNVTPRTEREVLLQAVSFFKTHGQEGGFTPTGHNVKAFDFNYLIERLKAQGLEEHIPLLQELQARSIDTLKLAEHYQSDFPVSKELSEGVYQKVYGEPVPGDIHNAPVDRNTVLKVLAPMANMVTHGDSLQKASAIARGERKFVDPDPVESPQEDRQAEAKAREEARQEKQTADRARLERFAQVREQAETAHQGFRQTFNKTLAGVSELRLGQTGRIEATHPTGPRSYDPQQLSEFFAETLTAITGLETRSQDLNLGTFSRDADEVRNAVLRLNEAFQNLRLGEQESISGDTLASLSSTVDQALERLVQFTTNVQTPQARTPDAPSLAVNKIRTQAAEVNKLFKNFYSKKLSKTASLESAERENQLRVEKTEEYGGTNHVVGLGAFTTPVNELEKALGRLQDLTWGFNLGSMAEDLNKAQAALEAFHKQLIGLGSLEGAESLGSHDFQNLWTNMRQALEPLRRLTVLDLGLAEPPEPRPDLLPPAGVPAPPAPASAPETAPLPPGLPPASTGEPKAVARSEPTPAAPGVVSEAAPPQPQATPLVSEVPSGTEPLPGPGAQAPTKPATSPKKKPKRGGFLGPEALGPMGLMGSLGLGGLGLALGSPTLLAGAAVSAATALAVTFRKALGLEPVVADFQAATSSPEALGRESWDADSFEFDGPEAVAGPETWVAPAATPMAKLVAAPVAQLVSALETVVPPVAQPYSYPAPQPTLAPGAPVPASPPGSSGQPTVTLYRGLKTPFKEFTPELQQEAQLLEEEYHQWRSGPGQAKHAEDFPKAPRRQQLKKIGGQQYFSAYRDDAASYAEASGDLVSLTIPRMEALGHAASQLRDTFAFSGDELSALGQQYDLKATPAEGSPPTAPAMAQARAEVEPIRQARLAQAQSQVQVPTSSKRPGLLGRQPLGGLGLLSSLGLGAVGATTGSPGLIAAAVGTALASLVPLFSRGDSAPKPDSLVSDPEGGQTPSVVPIVGARIPPPSDSKPQVGPLAVAPAAGLFESALGSGVLGGLGGGLLGHAVGRQQGHESPAPLALVGAVLGQLGTMLGNALVPGLGSTVGLSLLGGGLAGAGLGRMAERGPIQTDLEKVGGIPHSAAPDLLMPKGDKPFVNLLEPPPAPGESRVRDSSTIGGAVWASIGALLGTGLGSPVLGGLLGGAVGSIAGGAAGLGKEGLAGTVLSPLTLMKELAQQAENFLAGSSGLVDPSPDPSQSYSAQTWSRVGSGESSKVSVPGLPGYVPPLPPEGSAPAPALPAQSVPQSPWSRVGSTPVEAPQEPTQSFEAQAWSKVAAPKESTPPLPGPTAHGPRSPRTRETPPLDLSSQQSPWEAVAQQNQRAEAATTKTVGRGVGVAGAVLGGVLGGGVPGALLGGAVGVMAGTISARIWSKVGGQVKGFFGLDQPMHAKLGHSKDEWDQMSGGQKTRSWIDGFARKLTGGLVLGMAAGGNMLSAGAPDAFATLKGSIGLFAAQLGQTLIPLSVGLSMRFQQAAETVRGWSDSTRSTIGAVAKWGFIITVGALALAKLVTVVGTLWGGLVGLKTAVVTAATAVYAFARGTATAGQKWGVGLSLAGLVAGIGVTLYQMLKPKSKEEKEQEFEQARAVHDARLTKKKQFVSDDKLWDVNFKYRAETSDQSIKENRPVHEVMRDHADRSQRWQDSRVDGAIKVLRGSLESGKELSDNQITQLRDAFPKDSEVGKATMDLKRVNDTWYPIGESKEERLKEKKQNLLDTLEVEKTERTTNIAVIRRLAELSEAKATGKAAPPRGDETLERTEFDARQRKKEILFQLSSSTQAAPKFSSIEESYKQIQLTALGQSPLEAQRLKVELESRELLLAELRKIAKALNDNDLKEAIRMDQQNRVIDRAPKSGD
jgi:hypothetical protein